MYTSWPDCQQEVVGFKGNIYKSYILEVVMCAWALYSPTMLKTHESNSTITVLTNEVGTSSPLVPVVRMDCLQGFNVWTLFCLRCFTMVVVMMVIKMFV